MKRNEEEWKQHEEQMVVMDNREQELAQEVQIMEKTKKTVVMLKEIQYHIKFHWVYLNSTTPQYIMAEVLTTENGPEHSDHSHCEDCGSNKLISDSQSTESILVRDGGIVLLTVWHTRQGFL